MTAVLKLVPRNDHAIIEPQRRRMQIGFVAIPNEVIRAVISRDLSDNQRCIYTAILIKTIGFNKEVDCIASSQLSEVTGIDESHVRKALSSLEDAGMIQRGKRTKNGVFITPNLDASSWNLARAKSARSSARSGVMRPNKQAESATHKRQLQETSELPNGSSSAESSASPSACPHQRLIDLYHDMLPTCTRVREWNETRRRMMQARWREKLAAGKYHDTEGGLAYWGRFFAYVAKSVFLTGKSEPSNGRKPFLADLEWLIRPTNFAKVIEGKYHVEEAQ